MYRHCSGQLLSSCFVVYHLSATCYYYNYTTRTCYYCYNSAACGYIH